MTRWLRFPRAIHAAVAAAIVVALPSLFMGFFADDYAHVAMVEGLRLIGGRWDLFRFASGNAATLTPFIERGPYPWWTYPELKLAFFRPLSTLLANVDVTVFGHFAPAFHLHSILWYALLVFAVGLLYRRALPTALGAGAVLLFAIDGNHWIPAAWWANRNALIASVPAVFGLVAHLRWRESGWRAGLPLSMLGYALGLAGGETAIAVLAYVAAYELFGRQDSIRKRAFSLLPAIVVGLAYVVLYRALGYGASGSSVYIDPGAQPGNYLFVAVPRFFAVLSSALLNFPSDLWAVLDRLHPVIVAIGVAGALLLALLVRSAWRKTEEHERRTLQWLGAGALLSILPVLATFPAARLTLVPSIGLSPFIALAIRHAWRERPSLLYRLGAGWLAIVHIPISLLLWPAYGAVFFLTDSYAEKIYLASELEDAHASTQKQVLIAAPDFLTALYPPLVRAHHGHPLPYSWFVLSMAPCDHRLTRTAANRFELETINGVMLSTVFEQLERSENLPVPLNTPIPLEGITVRVLEEDQGKPTRVSFELDSPMEDPKWAWLHWRDTSLKRFIPPPVGASVLLPHERGMFGF